MGRYQQACNEKKDSEKPDVNEFINYDSARIHWDREIKNDLTKGKYGQYHEENIRQGSYRPFTKQQFYFCKQFNSMVYQQPRIFPSSDSKNLAICVSGIGASKEFSALMVDTVPNLHFLDTGQCFPRYRYISTEATGRQTSLAFGEVKHTRVDNIPEETLSLGSGTITTTKPSDADVIFYYVYGLLHSPDYKTRFSCGPEKDAAAYSPNWQHQGLPCLF